MDEYLCLTLLSRPNESEADFKNRLSAFWTTILRNHEAEFEKVYAESTAFGKAGEILSRQYLVEAEVADFLAEQLRAADMPFVPIDPDDLYSKYEAVPPDWFWIEH